VPVEGLMMTEEQILQALLEITPERNAKQFQADGDTDFAYELKGLGRFRCNLFRDHKGPGGVFRLIPSKILTTGQLGLPASVLQFCKLSKGLVVVTGPTGSGKSTTLAAIVDHVNKTRADHVITIEDPIEFVHQNQKCLVNQREVGVHTQGFKRALRAALREDPDIVLVGEMRDLETAETGHLVFGTLHTTTAPSTVDRIIDQFPEDRQAQIRTMLASSLKGVVAQTLCKKKSGGRIAAIELLVVTNAVAAQIREGKTFQIKNAMQTGGKQGMRLLNDTLAEYVEKGLVEPDEAYLKAVDKDDLVERLSRIGVRVSAGFEAGAAASAPIPVPAPAPAAALPKAAPKLDVEPEQAPAAPSPEMPAPALPSSEDGAPAEATGDPFEQFRRNRRR
jgi:twitching motility protein PilT